MTKRKSFTAEFKREAVAKRELGSDHAKTLGIRDFSAIEVSFSVLGDAFFPSKLQFSQSSQ